MEQDKNALPAILLKDVVFSWGAGQAPLLDIHELHIQRGEHVVLYGPSGSGKTSLLNILAGINVPQSGSVQVLGQSLTSLSPARRDLFRAQHMGIIFQQFNLIPYLNVWDNLMLRAVLAKQDQTKAKLKAQELLNALGLSGLLHHKAQNLSVGQQQRVAVARALINSPDIVIADEPTSALDHDNRDVFLRLLLANSANTTVVLVSHDPHLRQFFPRTLNLQTLSSGSARELAAC